MFHLRCLPVLASGPLLGAVLALLAPLADAMEASVAYEVEAGFPEIPMRGPTEALGLIVWNHGSDGNVPSYTHPPPLAIKALAIHGWDVTKLDRNPKIEAGGWGVGGQKDVAALLSQIDTAQKVGYRRIIVAGQSYGGAIALEAAARTPVFGVIAMVPGTGQTMLSDGTPFMNHTSRIERDTYSQVERLQAQRALFVLPTDDEFLPGVDRSPRIREIMTARGIPFIVVDRQVHGHGGGYGREFLPFAGCNIWFMSPQARLRPGEFHCGRDELPEIVAAMGLPLTDATHIWAGYFNVSLQAVAVIERPSGDDSVFDLGFMPYDITSNDPPYVRRDLHGSWHEGRFTIGLGTDATITMHANTRTGTWTLVRSEMGAAPR